MKVLWICHLDNSVKELGNGGEGLYGLVSEDGEMLYTHFCSNRGFAKDDLVYRRPERLTELNEKYGDEGWKIFDVEETLTATEIVYFTDLFKKVNGK